jgi:hypothetical protein
MEHQSKKVKLQNGYNLFVQERYQMAFLFTSEAFSSEQKMGGCDMYHSSNIFLSPHSHNIQDVPHLERDSTPTATALFAPHT